MRLQCRLMAGKRLDGTREERDGAFWDAIEEATELLHEGLHEEGLVELKRVLETSPNNHYAYHLLGQALWELGRIEPARDAFRAAVLLAPDFLGARVALVHALRRTRDLDEAERQAQVALSRFPGDGEAMHAHALVLAARGKRREARKKLEGFLGTKPEFEAATEARGVLEMLALGDDDEPLDVD
jgi:Flp pilus assembly protein TadD